jgi:L-ascorbate metabolism protein UlaG (beta-lactamase superfamily)
MLALIIPIILLVGVYAFLRSPKFGASPQGRGLDRIRKSPNYKNGQFQNRETTPQLAERKSIAGIMYEFFFSKDIRKQPSRPLPSVWTDLKSIADSGNILVWFGHSSYFMQIDGMKILIDPVFSGTASPVAATTRSFPGSDIYAVHDMPEIDILLITHDHWDHLDYGTVAGLRPKVRKIITSLGVGAHLERWGYDPNTIIELDWDEKSEFSNGFSLVAQTARHFSGRGFRRNQTLWGAFVLETPTKKIYIGGDSGYGLHFAKTGRTHGPFDLAILECGQYNESWPFIHMLPHQWIPAAQDLRAKAMLPVHWGKFALAHHPWDEPARLLWAAGKDSGVEVRTPRIGEKINLDNPQKFDQWWKDIS